MVPIRSTAGMHPVWRIERMGIERFIIKFISLAPGIKSGVPGLTPYSVICVSSCIRKRYKCYREIENIVFTWTLLVPSVHITQHRAVWRIASQFQQSTILPAKPCDYSVFIFLSLEAIATNPFSISRIPTGVSPEKISQYHFESKIQ